MIMFKVTILAIILSFILSFINEYFLKDLIDAMKRFKNEEDREIIRNVFRFSIFCMFLMTFIFFGLIITSFNIQ